MTPMARFRAHGTRFDASVTRLHVSGAHARHERKAALFRPVLEVPEALRLDSLSAACTSGVKVKASWISERFRTP